MKGLFRYPEKANFGQIIPMAKIYEYAKLKPAKKPSFWYFYNRLDGHMN